MVQRIIDDIISSSKPISDVMLLNIRIMLNIVVQGDKPRPNPIDRDAWTRAVNKEYQENFAFAFNKTTVRGEHNPMSTKTASHQFPAATVSLLSHTTPRFAPPQTFMPECRPAPKTVMPRLMTATKSAPHQLPAATVSLLLQKAPFFDTTLCIGLVKKRNSEMTREEKVTRQKDRVEFRAAEGGLSLREKKAI